MERFGKGPSSFQSFLPRILERRCPAFSNFDVAQRDILQRHGSRGLLVQYCVTRIEESPAPGAFPIRLRMNLLEKELRMMTDSTLKTVVGLFDDLGHAREAVNELKSRGFADREVSLVANASAEEYHRHFDTTTGAYRADVEVENHSGAGTGAGIGAVLGGLAGLLAGLSIITIPGIGPVLGAGPIASTLMGALAGGLVGGLLGALTDMGVPEEHAGYYTEGVRRGGTLVVVKTTAAQVDLATGVLQNHGPVDVEQRVSSWRQSGWTGYDPKAEPYTSERIAEERRSYARPGL